MMINKNALKRVCTLTAAIGIIQGSSLFLGEKEALAGGFKSVQRFFTSCVRGGRTSSSESLANKMGQARSSSIKTISEGIYSPIVFYDSKSSNGITYKTKVTKDGTFSQGFNESGDLLITTNSNGGNLFTTWFKDGQVSKTETRTKTEVTTTYYNENGDITSMKTIKR